jgi:hypothetical protein
MNLTFNVIRHHRLVALVVFDCIVVVMGIPAEMHPGMGTVFSLGQPDPCTGIGQRLPAHADHQQKGEEPTFHGG